MADRSSTDTSDLKDWSSGPTSMPRPGEMDPAWDAWRLAWKPKGQMALQPLKGLPPEWMKAVEDYPFLVQARPMQAHPPGPWRTWLCLGGRGAGKTRAGAEWVNFAINAAGMGRVALVGPALHDVREVMVDGPSGLMNLPGRSPKPRIEISRRRLVWPNGAEAYMFSAEDAESLRGPQFDAAWCDEVGAWTRGDAVWDILQMGLRLGPAARVVATTTPRAGGLVQRLVREAEAGAPVAVTTSATAENAANLSPTFVESMMAAYGGTVLGRQELLGEYIDDPNDAMFVRSRIDETRVEAAPFPLDDVVVAVDPPATSGRTANACGIVAVGRAGARAYVLGDASAPGLKPLDWAARAAHLAAEVGASHVIAEANQGGEMVRQTLETAGCACPVRLVHARLGKTARALPVAAAYAQGRVSHVGTLAALEDQMCRFGAEGFVGSPDRVDALVWAVWSVLLERVAPWVRRV